MHIYLGEDPDPSEALDFLSLVEGGEVIHYEALNTMAQSLGNTQASDTVRSILEEEKKHLMSCIQLVKTECFQLFVDPVFIFLNIKTLFTSNTLNLLSHLSQVCI